MNMKGMIDDGCHGMVTSEAGFISFDLINELLDFNSGTGIGAGFGCESVPSSRIEVDIEIIACYGFSRTIGDASGRIVRREAFGSSVGVVEIVCKLVIADWHRVGIELPGSNAVVGTDVLDDLTNMMDTINVGIIAVTNSYGRARGAEDVGMVERRELGEILVSTDGCDDSSSTK